MAGIGPRLAARHARGNRHVARHAAPRTAQRVGDELRRLLAGGTGDRAHPQAEESLPLKLYLGFFTVVVAPLGEELLFRGVLYPTLRNVTHPAVALWGTSLFFAAIHLNVMTFVPLTVLALVLTRLYQQTGNILAPFITHALFNFANFLFLMFGFNPDSRP